MASSKTLEMIICNGRTRTKQSAETDLGNVSHDILELMAVSGSHQNKIEDNNFHNKQVLQN